MNTAVTYFLIGFLQIAGIPFILIFSLFVLLNKWYKWIDKEMKILNDEYKKVL